jgi:hypothetical protein
LDDFITQMVSSKLLRGNRDEREHDALVFLLQICYVSLSGNHP